jgi:5-carboxymethyl-2-hydroxymuconate isomerase
MPHLVIEYSAGLEHSVNIPTLLRTTFDAAVAAQVMKPEDIKVRAIPYTHFYFGDGGTSFVHTTVHLLAGRTAEQKRCLSGLLREYQARLLTDVHSISVDIVDMDPAAYLKRLL